MPNTPSIRQFQPFREGNPAWPVLGLPDANQLPPQTERLGKRLSSPSPKAIPDARSPSATPASTRLFFFDIASSLLDSAQKRPASNP